MQHESFFTVQNESKINTVDFMLSNPSLDMFLQKKGGGYLERTFCVRPNLAKKGEGGLSMPYFLIKIFCTIGILINLTNLRFSNKIFG